MNLQKLRAMNLGAVADELEELRKFKAEIESQVPVGLVKTIGGYPDESEHGVDWLVKHHHLVDGQDLYTKPVPADKSTRITEKDIQEIANHIFGYISVLYPESAFENWFSKFGGRELLSKLNADRQVLDDGSAQKLWDYYQTLLKHYGFEGITDLLSKYHKLAEQVSAATHSDPIPWIPVLRNRADGVDGHYAIGRFNPSGYWEFWNLISHKWASASDGVLTFDEANNLLREITLSTGPAVAVPKPQKCCTYWRNDAIENAAVIADRHSDKFVAQDIRNMLSAPSHSQHNSNDEGFKLIPNPPCGFNLIAYNRHTEEWLYINHANTWQLFQGPNQGIKRLTKVEEWRESLTEMVQAMRSYEMDVDEPAPHKHRAMMDRAEALLAAAPPYSQQSAGDWLLVSVVLPPEGEPFQAFHENWIDEDFNVYGIRECHRYGDGTQYASAKWLDHQDCWIEDSEVPQLWRPYVKPARCPSHESEQLAGLVEALETALFGTPLDDVPNRDNDDIWRMCYPHLPERASGALRGHLARIEAALADYRKGGES